MDERLIESLAAAVAAAPEDVPLRVHLARLLNEAGRGEEAVAHLAQALAREPGSAQIRDLMTAALAGRPPAAETRGSEPGFDWSRAEAEVGDIAPPMFVDDAGQPATASAYEVQRGSMRLADVGGLDDVKARLGASFLAPLRNPEGIREESAGWALAVRAAGVRQDVPGQGGRR